jgi:hypothetical protein
MINIQESDEGADFIPAILERSSSQKQKSEFGVMLDLLIEIPLHRSVRLGFLSLKVMGLVDYQEVEFKIIPQNIFLLDMILK